MSPGLIPGTVAETVAERPPGPPPRPKLIVGDRRLDPTRLEHVIPPTVASEVGDAEELRAHRQTFKRWQAAAERLRKLRQQHAQAQEADQQAERDYAQARSRKLAEPTAPPLADELVGVQREVDVLESELIATARRLFAGSLEHVEAAQRRIEQQLDADDRRVEELLSRALDLLDERAHLAAEHAWLWRAAWEPALQPYLARPASRSRTAVELREVLRVLQYERAEAHRRRHEQAIEIEMLFEGPRMPRRPDGRPLDERRREAEQRVLASEATR